MNKKKARGIQADTPFDRTVRRLYALPVIERKIEIDTSRLRDMEKTGPAGRSHDIIARLERSGARVPGADAFEALKVDMEAKLASDAHEVSYMKMMLAEIEKDPFHLALTGKFLYGMKDEEIALAIPCGKSSVWRHRERLINRLSVLFYGSETVR